MQLLLLQIHQTVLKDIDYIYTGALPIYMTKLSFIKWHMSNNFPILFCYLYTLRFVLYDAFVYCLCIEFASFFSLQEVADNNCVYRNEITHDVGERTQVLQDVAADPTLPRTKTVRCAVCNHPEAVFFQVCSLHV